MKDIDAATLKGPGSSGPIAVRFEKLDLSARTVSLVLSIPGKPGVLRYPAKLDRDGRTDHWVIRVGSRRRLTEKPENPNAPKLDHPIVIRPSEASIRARGTARMLTLDLNPFRAYGQIDLEPQPNGVIEGFIKPEQINANHLKITLKLKATTKP